MMEEYRSPRSGVFGLSGLIQSVGTVFPRYSMTHAHPSTLELSIVAGHAHRRLRGLVV